MDIVAKGVKWRADHYTRRYPNFRFELIDVYNQMYHPEGTQKAADYRFLFPDEEFDFVVLNSVFHAHACP